jgi:hypothetical protein
MQPQRLSRESLHCFCLDLLKYLLSIVTLGTFLRNQPPMLRKAGARRRSHIYVHWSTVQCDPSLLKCECQVRGWRCLLIPRCGSQTWCNKNKPTFLFSDQNLDSPNLCTWQNVGFFFYTTNFRAHCYTATSNQMTSLSNQSCLLFIIL